MRKIARALTVKAIANSGKPEKNPGEGMRAAGLIRGIGCRKREKDSYAVGGAH